MPAEDDLSRRVSADLKKRGFRFVGPGDYLLLPPGGGADQRPPGHLPLARPGTGGDAMNSLFVCPHCGGPLERGGAGLRLPQRPQLRHRPGGVRPPAARQPEARQKPRRRQRHGFRPEPLPVRGLLRPPAGGAVRPGPGPAPGRRRGVLDSGCGEGYYTAGLWEALNRPRLAGGGSVPAVGAPGRPPGARGGVRRGLGVPPASGGCLGWPGAQLLLPPGAGGVPAGAPPRRRLPSMWCRGPGTCGS